MIVDRNNGKVYTVNSVKKEGLIWLNYSQNPALLKIKRKEDKIVGRVERREGVSGFIGEPRRTLCTELVGNNTIIPEEAWAEHSEEVEEMDIGIPRIRDDDGGKMFGRHRKFTSWIGYVADQIERQQATPEEESIAKEEETSLVEAAINLMRKIEVDPTPEMCNVVGAYIAEDASSPKSKGMNGVIRHYFQALKEKRAEAAKAVLEFILRLRVFMENEFHEKNFTPEFSEETGQYLFDNARAEENKGTDNLIKKIKSLEISSNAKVQMIKRAQIERSRNGNGDGPAYKLGEAIFGSRWKILLRATV